MDVKHQEMEIDNKRKMCLRWFLVSFIIIDFSISTGIVESRALS